MSSERPSSGADLSDLLLRETSASFPRGRADVLQDSTASSAQCPGAARLRLSTTNPPGAGTGSAPPPYALPPRALPKPRASPRAPRAEAQLARSRLVSSSTIAHWPGEALRPPVEHRLLFLQLLPPPPSSPLPHSSSHSLGGLRAPGLLEPFRNGNLRGGGVRAPGRRGAEAAGLRRQRAAGRASYPVTHQPDWSGRRWPGGRLSAPFSLCASPGSARGGVGATRRAPVGGGACFRESHFLREPVDSTPLSSLSCRLPSQFPVGSVAEGARQRAG